MVTDMSPSSARTGSEAAARLVAERRTAGYVPVTRAAYYRV